ncbi:ribonuclease III [Rubinisphaera margarita]|uniref:ribonuclease III n=1 Tax=Rubinisphaera margarita TaxID=2909586 RepID=UPI001EE7C889|nr:ribonuclease III [Rubinisphaera margarita]MCG6155111.1 ribonuclease III [Rubinisphaera margarita]
MAADSESTPLNPEHLEACEAALDYVFVDKRLLQISLTHASIAQTRLQSNERMEFLGDAILGAVVCDRLYSLFPVDEEGHLTQMKSEVVSRTACAQVALSLGLENFIHLSKGLHQSPEIPSSVLAGVFESLIGAIYLDGGYEAAFNFINRNLEHLIHHAAETEHIRNSKSQFQHYTQRYHGETPTYTLIEETGPDHSKCFLVSAVVGETRFPPAWGSNKKEAEQKAALNALRSLQGQPIPYSDEAGEDGATQGCGAEEQN